MSTITIVGLGPGSPYLLTSEAREILWRSSEVYVRTSDHPVILELPRRIQVISLDDLSRGASGSGHPGLVIAGRVLELGARPEGVVYAVPGHPLVADDSVSEILRQAPERGLTVRIVAGVSILDGIIPIPSSDPFTAGLVFRDASRLVREHAAAVGQPGYDPFSLGGRGLDPTVPVILGRLPDRDGLAMLQRILIRWYPTDHPVWLIDANPSPSAESARSVSLADLDFVDVSVSPVALYLPPVERLHDTASFETLRYIVARLRAPNGCPWDREQTHDSMKKHLIEETYEAISALEEGDLAKFAEELGDVLLQVVMHSQLAREAGVFELDDVLRAVNEKLIRRHPHVFGDVQATSSAEVLRNWERIKREENGGSRNGKTRESFASVPAAMPALTRADAVQSRAARHGWVPPTDLPDCSALLSPNLDRDERMRLLGDVLFHLVALARHAGLDPEEALRLATNRFIDRADSWLA